MCMCFMLFFIYIFTTLFVAFEFRGKSGVKKTFRNKNENLDKAFCCHQLRLRMEFEFILYVLSFIYLPICLFAGVCSYVCVRKCHYVENGFKESYKNRWTLNLMNYLCCYQALLYLSILNEILNAFFLQLFVLNVFLPRRHTKLRFYVKNIKNLMTLKMFLQKRELKPGEQGNHEILSK